MLAAAGRAFVGDGDEDAESDLLNVLSASGAPYPGQMPRRRAPTADHRLRAVAVSCAVLLVGLAVVGWGVGWGDPGPVDQVPVAHTPTAVPTPPASTTQGLAASKAAVAKPAPPSPAPAGPLTVLALGDSVPAGTACDCASFPTLIGQQIGTTTGRKVTVVNDAVPGLDSAQLLDSLRNDPAVQADVARAGLVLVTIGANDFAYDGDASCRNDLSCYQDDLTAMQANVDASVAKILDLSAPAHPTVMVTGYWSVWQDGAVGSELGQDFVTTDQRLTAATNEALSQVASAHGSTYVDLVVPFRPPAGEDDTALLAQDGDHPNAAGHKVIAASILAALPVPASWVGS